MTLSPDGNWFWNGNEWIPAPPTHAPITDMGTEITSEVQPTLEEAHEPESISLKPPLKVRLLLYGSLILLMVAMFEILDSDNDILALIPLFLIYVITDTYKMFYPDESDS